MNEKARELRSRLALRQQQVRDAEADVAALERSCQHDWTAPVYAPTTTPGRMEQNWMGPIRGGKPALPDQWVPPVEHPKWKRECRVCGKIEETTRAEIATTSTQIPKF